jgi:hypothetical protein
MSPDGIHVYMWWLLSILKASCWLDRTRPAQTREHRWTRLWLEQRRMDT